MLSSRLQKNYASSRAIFAVIEINGRRRASTREFVPCGSAALPLVPVGSGRARHFRRKTATFKRGMYALRARQGRPDVIALVPARRTRRRIRARGADPMIDRASVEARRTRKHGFAALGSKGGAWTDRFRAVLRCGSAERRVLARTCEGEKTYSLRVPIPA